MRIDSGRVYSANLDFFREQGFDEAAIYADLMESGMKANNQLMREKGINDPIKSVTIERLKEKNEFGLDQFLVFAETA